MAGLATGSTEVPTPPLGNDTGRSYRGSLLGEEVTVRMVIDDTGTTTSHVAHVVRDDVIIIVVVSGEADRATVERVLNGVTLFQGLSTDG
jgi:hypothetical protein